MGRTRTRRATTTTPSVSSLVTKAQDLIVQCDYDLARTFTERVLAREDATRIEKNQAKEMLAVIHLEVGNVDDAKQLFLSLVPPHPDAPLPPPPSAYLYLAQLTEDDPHTALAHYQSAIDLLQAQLKGKSRHPSEQDESEVKGNIVRAYLGMVEIWMDPQYDLCVDPAASNTCDALLSHALQIDPQNLETLQTLASVRLSQEKPEEAVLALRTFPPPPSPADESRLTSDPRSHALSLLNALPIQTRIARAKLLLECGAHPDALALLEGVLATDDTNIEGWYLMGWAWWLLAERKKDGDDAAIAELGEEGRQLEWQDMARDARDCLETCQTLHTCQEYPDIPLLEHVKELIGTLDVLGIQPSPAEDDGSDEEWEEVSDEDEDVEMA